MKENPSLFNKIRNYWIAYFRYNQYPDGVKFPFMYHIRWIARRLPKIGFDISTHIISPSGTKHYLSSDPLDERVTGDMLGELRNIYFPASMESTLKNLDGWIVDVGAFNGSWAVELLFRFLGLKAVLIEPNSKKVRNIIKNLQLNKLSHKARILESGLGRGNGRGWLVASSDGSWGNWLQEDSPSQKELSQEVSTITLEKALNGVQPVIVKCNAEGAEFELVHQLIALGLHPMLLILMVHSEFGDPDDLRNELIKNNYSVKVVRDYGPRPIWHANLL